MLVFYRVENRTRRVSMTRWHPPNPTGLPEYIGREVAFMTVFETIMVVLGVVNALIAFGSLLIALFSFLEKRKEQK